MRKRKWVLATVGAVVLALYAVNNAWSARPMGSLQVMAHRGVHHTYPTEGLERDTCTADRIHPPTHAFIENTLPSVAEAIRLGAEVIEIDVHPTTDGEFAVFHDWTLDCRTEGSGVTRERSMAALKTLDVGHGYTADGGRTSPMRGRGVGLMPTLNEMLDAFPDARFMINIKSNDASEADRLQAYLAPRGADPDHRLTFFAGDRPAARLRALRPQARIATKAGLRDCMTDYVLTGWTGRVPQACRRTVMFLPGNVGVALWGWPDRFLERMQDADSEVWMGGSADLRLGRLYRIDDAAAVARIPAGWTGGVDTDRIEVVGPLLAER